LVLVHEVCCVAQLLTNGPDADNAALAQPLMHRTFVDAAARRAGLLGALPNDLGERRDLGDRVPVVEALAERFAGCPAIQRIDEPSDHLADTILETDQYGRPAEAIHHSGGDDAYDPGVPFG
jgi:hypothetical protein